MPATDEHRFFHRCTPICNLPYQSNTNMNVRESFSKLKKKVKHQLTGRKHPGERKSNWKTTAPASAKLLLRGVRDSTDAFGPLKSIAGGLCFILENCEVWSSSDTQLNPRRSQMLQRTKANKQAIESLAPRVKALGDLLCAPVSDRDIGEESRRERLEQ